MEKKEFIEITNICLSLCYDLAGKSKNKNEVIELLIQDVFENIPNHNFKQICQSLKSNISNLTELEKDVFNYALDLYRNKKGLK